MADMPRHHKVTLTADVHAYLEGMSRARRAVRREQRSLWFRRHRATIALAATAVAAAIAAVIVITAQ